jgi:pseudomonalisin
MTTPAGFGPADRAMQHRVQRHVALVAALGLLAAAERARAAVPRDAVPGALCPESMRIESMILAFVPRDSAALDALLHDQLDPGSPRYHAWLTPTAFGDRFGAPPAAYAQALAWLAARGFERVRPWPGRLGISFDGPAGRVRRAFHTALREYTWRGRRHHAPEGPPLLPIFGSTRPSALLGLDSFAAPRPRARVGGTTFLAPADVATVYGLAPAYAAGARGLGASIAVVAGSDFAEDDVALFRRSFGLPPSPVVKHFVSSNPGIGDSSALLEVLLDTQWAGATAPEAAVIAVVGHGDLGNAINEAIAAAVNDDVAPVVNVSFDVCEPNAGAQTAAVYDALFRQAAAQGQSVLVAAGDAGAADCAPESPQPAVNALAASPWVTAVGGTTVDPRFDPAGSATGYSGEVVWNDRGGATGGGRSIFFAKPVWQTGPGVPADGARDVPDVALAASPTDPGFAVAVGGRGLVFGGTSVSAPIWAGMAALLVAEQGGALGLLNPELYRLGAAQAQGGQAVFHDVTAGTNAVGTTPGFAAGPGFDLATGWGSFDGAALLDAFAAPPRPCHADADCASAGPCTEARCVAQRCVWDRMPDGTPCGTNPCVAATCEAGACVAAAAVACDDGDPCTADVCSPSGGCASGPARGGDAATCVLSAAESAVVCASGGTPGAIARRLRQANRLLLRTDNAGPHRARRLVKRARQRLRQALVAAARNHTLAPACAAALRQAMKAGIDNATRLIRLL